jgi:nucleotide-binding universal stress UspA family protein
MLTATEKAAVDERATTTVSRDLGPILVATDGTASADAALRAAAMLARHAEAGVVVLGVLQPLPMVAADYGMMIPPVDSDDVRRKNLLTRVKEQVATVGPATQGWAIELRDGDPPAVIAAVARDVNARMIVVGLGHHDLLDRLFGSETALHVLRSARVPVLAVPPGFAQLPRRAVVATDFTFASVRAARVALELVDTARMVYLLHVAPRMELQPDAFAAWMALYGEGVGPAFERIKAELGLPEHVAIETVTRQGKPSRETLEFARSTQADLIITGSRGAGLVDRLLVGSTATGIIRGANCAVLAVPTGGVEERVDVWPPQSRTSIPLDNWATELDAFSRRNVGRRASLEVDDPELGAQAQERDYPFLGATYDHHDQRVEIMLGDLAAGKRHLTRNIGAVKAIDIMRDEQDRDWILRVAHGNGQTILALSR